MPLLGFGVYQNYSATPSCLEAFKAGYRHIDSAQVYKNEAAVGKAVGQSGLKRNEVFVSEWFLVRSMLVEPEAEGLLATKIVSSDHGYDSTVRAVDRSLQKLGFGTSPLHSLLPSHAPPHNPSHHAISSDYIDLFLIHNPNSGKTKRLETYKALLEAKEAGKVRSVGVSN